MSTASGDLSSEQPQRTSHQPGPLAILAATAMGGIIGTRMGKAPLILAAGAAALALLKQKRTTAPPAVPLSLPPPAPQPEPEIPAQSQVEEWLSRQIIREEQTPVIDFSPTDLLPAEPEDDYRPESFLLDEFDDASSSPPSDNTAFAGLTEPAPQPVPTLAPKVEEAEVEVKEPEALPPPPQVLLQVPPPTSPLAVADAAWTLGVDPMPSLNETAPYVAPAGSMFFSTPARQETSPSAVEPPPSNMFSTAPVRQEDLGPPLFFSTSVFQGATFPDEIQVAPSFETVLPLSAPLSSAESPAQESDPEPPTAAETTPEIPVELAKPGEASFDSPLAAVPQNPWQPQPDIFSMSPVFPPQSQTTSSVVEAEIILRPRAPTQNAVIAKSKFAPPSFAKHFSDEDSAPSPAEAANDTHFPGPLQSQHDPKPRPTWRSWWRGD